MLQMIRCAYGTTLPISKGLWRSSATIAAARSWLAVCALSGGFGTLAWLTTPAMAGCNSGNVANPVLLSSSSCQANAPNGALLAIGQSTNATGDGAMAIGYSMDITGVGAIGIGGSPQASGYSAISIGDVSLANANWAISIGLLAGTAIAPQPGFIAIGAGTGANIFSTAIGNGHVNAFPSSQGARALGQYSVAIGGGDDNTNRPAAFADETFGVAMGTGAAAIGVRSTAIGAFAGLGSAATNNRNSAFGEEAGQLVTGGGNTATGLAAGISVTGDLNSALGNSAGVTVNGNNNTAAGVLAGVTVNGSSNAAFGDNAGRDVTGGGNIAIGLNAGRNVAASDSVAIGTNAVAQDNRSVAIGSGSKATIPNTVSVGRGGHERRIMNVAAAARGTDAVNLAQVQALIAAGPAGFQKESRRHLRTMNVAYTQGKNGSAATDPVVDTSSAGRVPQSAVLATPDAGTNAELVALRAMVEQLQAQVRELQLERRSTTVASME